METDFAPIKPKLTARTTPESTGDVTTAARMGFGSDVRLLMINADDFGLCGDANSATIEGLESGVFTSATVMVPAPGFTEAAAFAAGNPHIDIGVHLTLNSEWPDWRWGPVLGARRVPSLVDKSGFFRAQVHSLFAYAKLDEIEMELRAQVDCALDAGIDVSHLDCHMGPLNLRADYHAIYRALAQSYRLPIRIPPRPMMRRLGMTSALTQLDADGILYPDNFISGVRRTPKTTDSSWRAVLESLPAGISEIYCHPVHPGEEIRRFASDAGQRIADFDFFRSNATALRDSMELRAISYRDLRAAMRASDASVLSP